MDAASDRVDMRGSNPSELGGAGVAPRGRGHSRAVARRGCLGGCRGSAAYGRCHTVEGPRPRPARARGVPVAAESDDLVSEPDGEPVDDDAPGHGEERAARFADEFSRLAAGDGVPRAWAWSLAHGLAGDAGTHTAAELAARVQVSPAEARAGHDI